VRKVAVIAAALMIALAGVVAQPRTAKAVDAGAWQFKPATGHYYRLVLVDDIRPVAGLTWTRAEEYALSVGGQLVTINDQAEQSWLAAAFTHPQLWIGLTDQAVEGTWVWSSGEPVTYMNWVADQPDNCLLCSEDQGENAAVMNWAGQVGWNDLALFDTHSGAIVEVASLPRGPVGGTASGTARYWVLDEQVPALERQVSVSARGSDPLSGRWSVTYVAAKTTVSGDVTCLVVDGDRAWLAGRITSVKKDPTHFFTVGEGAFLWVSDGSLAGVPDRAYAWMADAVEGQPGASLAEMEAWCLDKAGNMADSGFPDGFTVGRGDISVQPAP
jgi:hypothetical protein